MNEWPAIRARFLFREVNERGFGDLPLASVTKAGGVEFRDDLDISVWNPTSGTHSYKRVAPGDFVIGLRSFQSGIGHSNLEGLVSPAYTVLRPTSERIHARYYRHYFKSDEFVSLLDNVSQGIRQGRTIATEDFYNLAVPVPPFRVQRAIADYLDAETARIDALIAKKRRMIGLVEERFRARVHESVVEYPRVRLRRLLASPPQYGASEPGAVAPADWPRYIRITDIAPSGRLRGDDPRFLDPQAARPFRLEHDDLLVARSGATSGKSFRFTNDMGSCAFAGYLIRLRFDDSKLVPGLAEFWMMTDDYWSQIRESSVQATIDNVSAERYKQLLVPVPPVGEQGSMLCDLRADHRRAQRQLSALGRQIDLLAEKRQALITFAVTGELSVPEAAA